MISVLSNKIALILHKNDDENLIDIEVYSYGLELIISTLANVLVMVILSVVFGCFKEMVFYFMFFSMLRVFAGGYHASTHLKCILFYSTTSLMVIWIVRNVFSNGYGILLVVLAFILATLLVLRYAPVDSVNKPFSETERKIYRLRSKQVILVQSVVLLILFIVYKDTTIYMLCCVSGMLMESITLIPVLNKQGGK